MTLKSAAVQEGHQGARAHVSVGLSRVAWTLVAAAVLALAAPAWAFEPLPRSTPEEREIDSSALASAFAAMGRLDFAKGMVVVRDGHVVAEEHWQGTASSLRQSRSVTKSVTSILVGIALEKGIFGGFDERLVDHLPPDLVPSDPAKAEINLNHLLTMTAGFEWDEDNDVVPWLSHPDPVGEILGRPLVAAPGTAWNYNTAATHLLSVMLTEASGMSTLEFADAHLFGPLGITDRSWLVLGGYESGGHGLHVRTEDLAKLGVLLVDGGVFGGERVHSTYWVNRSTRPTVFNIGAFGPLTDIHYGLLWWLDRGTDRHIYTAWGWGGQFVFCVPSLKLVVATHANHNVSSLTADQQEAAILEVIVDEVLPAVTDRRLWTATGQPVPELGAVDDMMEEAMRTHEIRGASTALVKDGRLVLARGYTLGEPEVEPLQPTALFRIASIAKAITSIAVHQLIEQGQLEYTTRVTEALDLQPLPGATPDPRLDTVTVDHLLTHTSGMYSEDNVYEMDDAVVAATGAEPPPTIGEIVSYVISKPWLFEPGTNWDYNNCGYLMLAMLVESVTGLSYPDYVLDRIFRPVGVGRPRVPHRLRSEAAPTEVDYDGWEGDPYDLWIENVVAAGSWVMAAPDLARLFSALFDDEEASGLMSGATRSQMLELPFPVSEQLGYGRGWMHESMFYNMGNTVGWLTDPDDGLPVYAHGGGGTGVHTLALWRGDGITFVMLTNKDPVIETIDFPAITSWPEHDLWESVGVSLDPVDPAPTEAWLPIVASADGAGGSVWRSDVGLLNRSTLANEVRLRFFGDGGPQDLELELAPGEYRTLADVVGVLGLQGTGPLQVASSEPLTVTSRTYNQASTGTFGQYLGSTAPTRGLSAGDTVVLMQLREDPAARTNIGLCNPWKREAEVEISLYDDDGSLVAAFQQEVAPEQTVQLTRPFTNMGGRSDIVSGYAVVRVESGQHLLIYASVVDNGSNDPTTIPSKPTDGAQVHWVAAAAHAAGANDSLWRTDLALLNLGGQAASAQVRFHADDGETAELLVALADGEQVLLEDVVAQAGTDGTGSVEVVSDGPVLVTSRTYNASVEGTFGQFLDGVNPAVAAPEGEIVWLPQLRQDEVFRSNIGLLNVGAAEARVRVRLFDSAGELLTSRNRDFGPGQRIQLQEPFRTLAGRDDIEAGYASVEVRSGSGILCFGSVIDNATNDATTVPMLF